MFSKCKDLIVNLVFPTLVFRVGISFCLRLLLIIAYLLIPLLQDLVRISFCNLCEHWQQSLNGLWCNPSNYYSQYQTDFSEARKNCWLSEQHTGHTNFTMYGRTCQRWTSQSPHSHAYGTDDKFPYDCSASEAENYCRDPSGYGKLWCYTINSEKRWEECEGVPICKSFCVFKTYWPFLEHF